MAQSRVGTPLYLAPELIKRQPYDFKADVWAAGVLVYTLAARTGPFKGNNIYSLGHSIVHETPPPLPKTYSAALCGVIFSMLEKAPALRPSVDELLRKMPRPKSHSVDRREEEDEEASLRSTERRSSATGGGGGGGG